MTDRNAEIALARTAAPKSISADATILVLGQHGYETAVKGKNGFVCIVERAWMSPFDHPEFWNPKNRSPICYNPPAARSILPYTFKRTELVLAGLTNPQMLDSIKAAVAKKGTADAGTWRDVLHVVEGTVPYRFSRALVSPFDVSHSKDRRRELGCEP